MFGGACCDGEHGQAAVLELLQPERVKILLRPVSPSPIGAKAFEGNEWKESVTAESHTRVRFCIHSLSLLLVLFYAWTSLLLGFCVKALREGLSHVPLILPLFS